MSNAQFISSRYVVLRLFSHLYLPELHIPFLVKWKGVHYVEMKRDSIKKCMQIQDEANPEENLMWHDVKLEKKKRKKRERNVVATGKSET